MCPVVESVKISRFKQARPASTKTPRTRVRIRGESFLFVDASNGFRNLPNGRLRFQDLLGALRGPYWLLLAKRQPTNQVGSLIVDVGLKEACQSMKVASRFDMPDHSHKVFGIDEFFEGDESEVKLSLNRYKDAIEAFFDQGSVGPNAKLAAEDDVIGEWTCTTTFVSDLNTIDFPLISGALGVGSGNLTGE